MKRHLINKNYVAGLFSVIFLVTCLFNHSFAMTPKSTNSFNYIAEETSDLISIDIKDVKLKDLLNFVGDNYKIQFIFNEELPEIKLTVKAFDVPWTEVLGAVLEAHNISYQLVDNKCYISINKDSKITKKLPINKKKSQKKYFGDPGFKSELITVDIKDVTLDSMLRFVSDNYKFSFSLHQSISNEKVTVKVEDQAWAEVLEKVFKEHNLAYNQIGQMVYIFPLSEKK